MADEAFGSGRRSLLGVVQAETLRVERGLDVARVARRSRAAFLFQVAGLAIRHAELGRDDLRSIVALDTVNHLRQFQGLQTCALRNGVMTGGAGQMVLLAESEMRNVSEP